MARGDFKSFAFMSAVTASIRLYYHDIRHRQSALVAAGRSDERAFSHLYLISF